MANDLYVCMYVSMYPCMYVCMYSPLEFRVYVVARRLLMTLMTRRTHTNKKDTNTHTPKKLPVNTSLSSPLVDDSSSNRTAPQQRTNERERRRVGSRRELYISFLFLPIREREREREREIKSI